MAKTGSNFSILADVELDLTSIKEQLKKAKITFDIDGKSIKVAGQSLDELAEKSKEAGKASKNASGDFDDMALSIDVAGRMFRTATESIGAFVNQVFELDTALTEFKKVSDLSGDSLDNYVSKLSEMGKSVARTGKPNRSEPVCCDGKAA